MQNIRQIKLGIFVLSIATGLLLAVAGCGKKSTGLTGKWLSAPSSKSATTVNIEFKADGTVTQRATLWRHTVEGNYNYVIKDDTVNETFISGSLDGKPMKASEINHPNEVFTFKLDGDRLLMKPAGPGPEVTLKRAD